MQTVTKGGRVHLRRQPTVDRVQGAQPCALYNRGRSTIPAYGIAAAYFSEGRSDPSDSTRTVGGAHVSLQNEPPGILGPLGFNVVHPDEAQAGAQLFIAAERIDAGAIGRGYCDGVVQAFIDDDTKSAILAAGNPTILHEESTSPGQPKTGAHRWAIVRFGGQPRPSMSVEVGGEHADMNTVIDGTFRGVKYSQTPIFGVTHAYDPDAPVPIVDDGIGYAQAADGTSVLILTRDLRINGRAIALSVCDFDVDNGVRLMAKRLVRIPIFGSSATVAAWTVDIQ
jgi:hypothetical protein